MYLTNGEFCDVPDAIERPLFAAAANWHALATFTGRYAPQGPALLIDIGSTTTDIIPLVSGQPTAVGHTDPERLAAGELVYTGVQRSPVCALVSHLPWRGQRCPVAQELFATTLDAYLLLGDVPEEPENRQTADERPATRTAAHARLVRMICADREFFSESDAVAAAAEIREAQLKLLEKAVQRVVERLPEQLEAVVDVEPTPFPEPDATLLGDPIGRDRIVESLAHELIAYSPEELIQIGLRELEWCAERMAEAADDLGFADWREALEYVKGQHVPPGEQDELVAKQAREAIDFLKRHDLVTIPPLCEELWRVRMLSPEGQRTLPFAAYSGQHMLVAYPTTGMTHDDKLMSMRGNNRHFSRIVTPHELIPGHHLQGFMARRERPYRSIFSTPFFVEGWALYWELMLWEKEYAQSAEDRIGMLFWRMHRCARIIISLKYHMGQMEPREMINFLVERVGHEEHTATSEVRRYIGGDYSPLYQVGDMIGRVQIRAMYQGLVGGGRVAPREFHDALLTDGPIPIELMRAGMMNLPLARDTRATWRFAE